MSRTPWLGRSTGKHAAPSGRSRAKDATRTQQAPEPNAPAAAPAVAAAPPDDAPWAEAERAVAGFGAVREPDGRPPQHVPPWEQQEEDPPWGLAAGGGMLGAPTMADVRPAAAGPLVSPVTDAARQASAGSSALLPAYIPAGSEPVVTIDALGRECPIPIIMLAEQIRDVPVGAVIAVLADDPAAYSDIPAWCGLKSHDCVFRAGYATGWSFGIRRRY
jgi:tRNA 2-thiouridine synthesizing protein A